MSADEAKKPTKAEMRAAVLAETEAVLQEQRQEIIRRARKRLKIQKEA
jgi:hypothetical protein